MTRGPCAAAGPGPREVAACSGTRPYAGPVDTFARPTATPQRLLPWLAELGATAAGLADALLPGDRSLSPQSREQIVLAITEVNGCRYTAWIHGAWRDFLGDAALDEALPLLLDFARDSALAGAPVDTSRLEEALPPRAIRSVRATVAAAELSSLFGNTVDGLWARLRGRRPFGAFAAAGEAVVVAAGAPLLTPALVAAGMMRLATRLAPTLPPIERPPTDDANLVVHMLAEAVPQYLANAAVRAVVLRVPAPLVIGVRAEETEATVRISPHRIVIENGIGPDAFLVVDGGLELLLDVATRTLSRELAGIAGRRG